MISERSIAEIKDLPIEQVIGKHMTLSKSGANYKGCCPIHGEKTPSLTVSPAKSFFKCFGCGVGGDSIMFIQKLYGLSFYDAVQKIAEENKIEIEEELNGKTPEEAKFEKDRKVRASELLHSANELFKKNQLPLEYLHGTRKITSESIDLWQLGYADQSFNAVTKLPIVSENLQLALDIGIINKKQDKIFDFFINRITIPIHNHIGQLVSFGARKMPGEESESPKFINGKDTFFYNKSNVLFGLDKASKAISEKGYAFLVEGYFDVIKMHQHDHTNTIATCGTSLTDAHCKLLKRYASHIILIRDSDKAGISAMMRDVPILVKNGLNVSLIELPEGEDPDSYLDNNQLNVSTKKDAIQWWIQKLRDNTFDDVAFIEKSTTLISEIQNQLSQELYIDWFQKTFKLTKKIVSDAVNKKKAIEEKPQLSKSENEDERLPDWVDVNQLYSEGFVMNFDSSVDKRGIYFKGNNKPVERLTNYTVKPLFFVMDPLNSRRLVEVDNGKRNNVVELPNRAFTAQDTFETELMAKGAYYSEPGFGKHHFKRLVNWLSDTMLNVHTLNTLGWQPEGFFAFSNLSVKANDEGIVKVKYDDYGIVQIEDKAYLSEGASKLNTDFRAEDNLYENDMYLKFVDAPISIAKWAELLYKVYDEDAMFGISFIFIAAFKDLVTKIAKCPHLYCYGPKGSGKSEFAESLMYFFFSGKNSDGKLIQSYNLNPGQGTPFSFFSRQGRFRNVLMCWNEYDPNTIEFWKKGAFKSSYDGEGREVGSGETGKKRKTVIQKTNCVNILVGQYLDTTDDGAVLSRSIPCKFSLEKNKMRPSNQKEMFRELKEYEQKGISSLVADLYTSRHVVANKLKDAFWLWQKNITDDMRSQGKQIESRLLSNYSLAIAITDIMSKQLTLPFELENMVATAKRRMIAQSDLLRDNNALNSFWRVVEALFDDGFLQDSLHFKVKTAYNVNIQGVSGKNEVRQWPDKRQLLYLRFNLIYERFAKRYREVYNKTAPDQDTLVTYLKDQKYFIGLCPSSSFKDKKTSAYVLYYETLREEMNVILTKDGGYGDGSEPAEESILPENNENSEKNISNDDLPF